MANELAVADDPLPAGLIRLRDGRIVCRRHGWLEPGGLVSGDMVLRCPFDHHVRLPLHFHKGAITVECTARTEGHGFCGSLLYLSTGEMGVFYADVTKEEAGKIKRLAIHPTRVARFLRL